MNKVTGTKNDAEKIQLDLIPPVVIEALGKVLTQGAATYGSYNWQKGLNYSRVYAATQRHLNKFWSGKEDIDPDSHFPHLWHVLCNVAFLIYYEANPSQYQKFNDQPNNQAEFYKKQANFIENIETLVQDNPKFFNAKLADSCLEKATKKLQTLVKDSHISDKLNVFFTKFQNIPVVKPIKSFPDLTKMTHPEACKFIYIGMKVTVLNAANSQEREWDNAWVKSMMDECIKNIYTVTSINKQKGIGLKEDKYHCGFPAFVLKIVEGE